MRATPWGIADHVEQVAEGITFYSTPSHGGYHLSPERVADVPQRYRDYAAKWSKGHGDQWYEEDCAALAVVLTFPEHFPRAHSSLEQLRERMEDYCE